MRRLRPLHPPPPKPKKAKAVKQKKVDICTHKKKKRYKMSREGEKVIYIRVKASLYETLHRLSIDSGLSCKEIIEQYLRYLRKNQHAPKWVLHEGSEKGFQLEKHTD